MQNLWPLTGAGDGNEAWSEPRGVTLQQREEMERNVSSAVVWNLRKGQKELFSNSWDTCGCFLESDEKHPPAFGDSSWFCRAPEGSVFFYPWVTCHIHAMRMLLSTFS